MPEEEPIGLKSGFSKVSEPCIGLLSRLPRAKHSGMVIAMSTNGIVKILAVCSALVLGGGFVAYRQMEQAETPSEPLDGASLPVVLPSSKNPSSATVLPSSKSIGMPVFSPRRVAAEDDSVIPALTQESLDGKVKTRPLLPGSKIGVILRPEDPGVIDRKKNEERKKDPFENPPPP
jgi:hypothetical protein